VLHLRREDAYGLDLTLDSSNNPTSAEDVAEWKKIVKRGFREASREWHPDKLRAKELSHEKRKDAELTDGSDEREADSERLEERQKLEARRMFERLQRAKEVLQNEEMRQAYDYFLDHPDDEVVHFFR
jgi:hypothetical protein